MATKPRFKEKYEKEIKSALKKKYGYANDFQVPKLDKIVINMGLGDATQNRAVIEAASNDLARITGQKPVVTRARQSNASFKTRQGMAIGIRSCRAKKTGRATCPPQSHCPG